MIDLNCLDFPSTQSFSRTFLNYQRQVHGVQDFIAFTPDEIGLSQALEAISSFSYDRATLSRVLKTQYSSIAYASDTSKLTMVFDKITDRDCYFIVTGHQLCLFTGPLYFVYKVVTTIRLAEEMRRKHPQKTFIPLFWLASEDHDVEEINHVNLFGKSLKWDVKTATVAGELSTSTMETVLAELFTLLGDSPNAGALKEILSECYGSGLTLADATRLLLHRLFFHRGLISIDANDPDLKRIFLPYMERDVDQENQRAVLSVSKKFALSAAFQNEKVQVFPREVNLFHMKNGVRRRIIYENSQFVFDGLDQKYSKPELIRMIRSAPESFSPNVILRPLYQQVLLPCICYIGGPSEVAYWLVLKEVFNQNKVFYPVVGWRNCAVWIDKNTNGKIRKLDLEVQDFFSKSDEIIKKYLLAASHLNTDITKEVEEVSEVMMRVSRRAGEVDRSLEGAVLAERQKIQNSLNNLQAKIIKAAKAKEDNSIVQIRAVKEKLFPSGSLQERYENFMPLYLKFGPEFFEHLLQQFQPLDHCFYVFTEN